MYANMRSSKGLQKKHVLNVINSDFLPFVKEYGDDKAISEISRLRTYVKDGVKKDVGQFFSINANQGNGNALGMYFYFKLHQDGTYDLVTYRHQGSFTLAATLVITSESKSNLFSSSSKDVINYIPRRGVTKQDVDDFMYIMPTLADVVGKILPEIEEN